MSPWVQVAAVLLPQQGQDRLKPTNCGTVSWKNPALGKYWQDPLLQELQHPKVREELSSWSVSCACIAGKTSSVEWVCCDSITPRDRSCRPVL